MTKLNLSALKKQANPNLIEVATNEGIAVDALIISAPPKRVNESGVIDPVVETISEVKLETEEPKVREFFPDLVLNTNFDDLLLEPVAPIVEPAAIEPIVAEAESIVGVQDLPVSTPVNLSAEMIADISPLPQVEAIAQDLSRERTGNLARLSSQKKIIIAALALLICFWLGGGVYTFMGMPALKASVIDNKIATPVAPVAPVAPTLPAPVVEPPAIVTPPTIVEPPVTVTPPVVPTTLTGATSAGEVIRTPNIRKTTTQTGAGL